MLSVASFLLVPLFVFGVYHLLTWFNIGNVPHALVQESMRQFAAEVMPYL